MSKLAVTSFNKRTGSHFQKGKEIKKKNLQEESVVHQDKLQITGRPLQKNTNMDIKKKNLQEESVVPKEARITGSPLQKNNKEDIKKINSQEESVVHQEVLQITGSPIQNNTKEDIKKINSQEEIIVHEEVQKTNIEKQKEKQNELIQKVNKKTAEYQSNKPSSGVFTEVVTHGAFTTKSNKDKAKVESATSKSNGNGSKLLGFPSSANDLALDAKTDLESDKNISKETKEKVIEKLFTLVSMVQHMYESKVRIMTEYEKFKDTHHKNELRREKEHSEQLYKINMNFQNEVIQSIQRLKSELDISSNLSKNENDSSLALRASSVEFISDDGLSHTSKNSNNEDTENNNMSKDIVIEKDSEVV